ncbi:serine hydrolase domain-containing protein [Aquimarina sp. 2201CG5-10]|uniref:serine hydrolase domain-containing protein n=1 Tax=Aquimarina callyspongiae TaxID=3098150 RepID=UPI002AB3EA3C|nr:serine hydrolase domain-containing protein [Aquimarina sp. 2201CG5-10]MDY8136337.1 serine hydrolase domain-containing protein [Aquimarina sp. 2201CG5-10]
MKKPLAKLFYLLPFLIILVSCNQRPESLDDLLIAYETNGQRKKIKSPFSGAVLVAKDGKVIFKKAYGYADKENKISNTTDTKFSIASVTKQFTAMLVMQQVEKGILSLEDTISKHLPYFSKELGDQITIHQLLSHTSGLPHYEGLQKIGLNASSFFVKKYTPQDFATLIGKTKLAYKPGATYYYSSLGYILLGAILEEVSGKTYNQLLQSSIIQPLGLKNTGYGSNDFIKNEVAKGYVFQELEGIDWLFTKQGGKFKNAPFRDQSNKYSTGGMHSTVEDLYIWSEAIKSHKLLSPELTKKMLTTNKSGYCYGWYRNWDDLVERNTNIQVYTHGGTLPGFNSSINLFDDGTTIIFLANVHPLKDQEVIHQVYLTAHQLEDKYRLGGYPDRGSLSQFEKEGGISALNAYFDKLSKLCGYKVLPSENSITGIMYLYLKDGQKSKADSLKTALFTSFYPTESSLNRTGYDFLEEEECEFALDFFKENTKNHPDSANAWDSLGEGYEICGNYKKAAESYSYAVLLAEKNSSKSLKRYQENLKRAQKIIKN